ncbi:prepilin-type N-terminal cleavage/methylation domain-containing protein [Candidatus Saganbacteria bacterium]|nr:prepilin-type N-terminal cleavage/methylation domain-containing protein [Candidatus Saganbacteria bacterium]
MSRKARGFTMIELVVVIAILALVVLGSSLYTNFINSIKIDGAASKLAADIRYAQSMSMSTATWYGVSIEANPQNRYMIYSTTGIADSIIEDPARFGSNFIVNTLQDFNASISSVNIGGGRKVEFSPLGAPYSDKLGQLITAEGIISLMSGSYSKTVRITPNTGRVNIQ